MIQRYTRSQMGEIWTQKNRCAKMLLVEQAVAGAQAELGLIPEEAARAIREKAAFSLERIEEIEKTTRHDVIAFVSSVAESVGPLGRYVHFGLTSSDVLDTAMSLIVREAGCVLLDSVGRLSAALGHLAVKYGETLCAGRTHGMHAEPTTFGLKMAGFWAEAERNGDRLRRSLEQFEIGKLSGAVGTYSTQTEEVERLTCEELGLKPETFATQVIPRDRHAELFSSVAILGAGIERLAVELRHLQRTEVAEVIEGFAPGQKGSSAMPHKKNPIASENVTGCARLLRGYAHASLENVALWHERDISHSSTERVIFPDAFILADYMADRMATVVTELQVDPERMRANMDLSQGQLFSSHFLLALVDHGMSREAAYAKTQALSHSLKPGQHLRAAAMADPEVRELLNAEDVARVFSGERHLDAIRALLRRHSFAPPPHAALSSPTSADAAGWPHLPQKDKP
jgi:adenylosuccinate lyase